MAKFNYLLYRIINIYLIILIIIMKNFLLINGDCPKYCDCKWKNGKETVLCLNVNLTIIPHNLDAGTQVLDLTGNDITKILHDAFLKVGLINLQKVYLTRCKLKMIDRYAFRKIKNLVELDLSYNNLNVIPSQIFGSIGELRDLKLNGNPIQKITNDAFINLPQLLRLELTNCKINYIERDAFHGIENTLEWLKLDGNKIVDLQSTTITSLENLNGIELNKNPWNCSCIIKPLIEWLMKYKISQTLSPTCRYPLRLINKEWDRLRLDEFACVPQIWTITDNFYENEGKNITIKCEFSETLEPNIKWKFNNKLINLEKKFNLKKYFIDFNENSTSLIIYDLDLNDNGQYTCIIENKAGKIEKNLNLEIQQKNGLPNFQKIIIFIIFFIFILFIIFITFLTSIFLWRRKRKLSRKNYKKTHDYEKIDRFNLATSNSLNLNPIQQINSTSSLCLTSGNCGKIVKVEDFPLRQYREYKHIPSDDDDDDDDDDDYDNNDDDDDEIDSLELNHIGKSKKNSGKSTSKKNRKSKIMLNNLTNCRRERTTTNWIGDVHDSKDISLEENHKRRDQSNKRRNTNSTKLTGDEMGDVVGGSHNRRQDARHNNNNNNGTGGVGNEDDDDDDDDNLFKTFSKKQPNFDRHTTNLPLKGFKPNFSQHIMTKKNLQNNNCSLYTSEILADNDNIGNIENHHQNNENGIENSDKTLTAKSDYPPDLLDLPKFNKSSLDTQNYYENYFNMYSTLPITKTVNSTNYHNTKDRLKKINCDDSQASLISSSSNEKIIPRRTRRYSVDSYSYIPSSSNSSSSFSLMNTATNSLYNKPQRSSSYLNLVSPETKIVRAYPSLPSSPNNTPSIDRVKEISTTTATTKSLRIPSTATPLLDFSSFPLHTRVTSSFVESPQSSKLLYDYHTTQLEYFIQEYRKLQDQLKKIGGLPIVSTPTTSNAPTSLMKLLPKSDQNSSIGQSAKFADPLMYNDVWSSADLNNPDDIAEDLLSKSNPPTNLPSSTSILKKKPLTNWNKSPDPPPYWLHRNAMLKQLNSSNNNNNNNSSNTNSSNNNSNTSNGAPKS